MTKKQKAQQAELQEMYSEALGDFEKFFKGKRKAMKKKCEARRKAKDEQTEKKDQQE